MKKIIIIITGIIISSCSLNKKITERVITINKDTTITIYQEKIETETKYIEVKDTSLTELLIKCDSNNKISIKNYNSIKSKLIGIYYKYDSANNILSIKSIIEDSLKQVIIKKSELIEKYKKSIYQKNENEKTKTKSKFMNFTEILQSIIGILSILILISLYKLYKERKKWRKFIFTY